MSWIFCQLRYVSLAALFLATTAKALVYSVKNKDTLSQIAKKYLVGPIWGKGGGLQKVLAQNPQLKDANLIFPGDEIHITPDQSVAEEEGTTLDSNRAPSADASSVEVAPITAPAAAAFVKNDLPVAEPSDGSWTSVELSPFVGIDTLYSHDKTSGSLDTVASNVYGGVNARFNQNWNESFKTYLSGGLSYISFAPPTNSSESLAVSSKFLTSFGLGFSDAVSSRFSFGGFASLEQNLFLRASSSTTVTADSVMVPTAGVTLSYDLIQRQTFSLGVSAVYEEKMKASTDSYSIGLGNLYGGAIEVRDKKDGEDRYGVALGAYNDTQNTTATYQNQTVFALTLKLYFPGSKPKRSLSE